MPNKKAIRNVEHKCSTPSDEIQPSIVADFNYAGVLSSVCGESDRTHRWRVDNAEREFTSSLAASRWMIAVCG